MSRARVASAQLCVALGLVSSLAACDGGAIDVPDTGSVILPDGALLPDAGLPTDDAFVPRADAGTACTSDIGCDDGDPTTRDACVGGTCEHTSAGCTADWDCSDFDACTSDTCTGGTCTFSPIPMCSGCRSDAECDDANPNTTDVCDTYTRACQHFPNNPFCGTASDCDDGNPCTIDQCNSGTCAWGSNGLCCLRDTDCNDYDTCTADACDLSTNTCNHASIPGCGTSSCMDYDGDGHGSMYCYPTRGDDCDDFNAAVHPGATESCTNGVDDDCNGRIDGTDPACSSDNTTCAMETMLTLPAMAHGTLVSTSTIGTPSDGTCGSSVFYSFTIPATSDVSVAIHLDDLPADPSPPTCPGCPPPTPAMHEIWHNVIVERACGDATSAVGALTSGGGCYTWSPTGGFFGGGRDHTLDLRRVPAGTYTIEVQAKDFFGWMPIAISFDLTVSATPSAAAACTGATLTDGSTTHGSTTGAGDAFGLDCSGTAFSSPEVVHAFDLAERRRVRLIGTPAVAMGSYPPGMQLALRDACDPDVAPVSCIDTSGYTCQPSIALERILDAGHHLVEIQSLSGAVDYDLSFVTEPVGAACVGASVISASGSFSGNTTGTTDHFRWNDACGGGTAGEVVYELDVATPSRVVLDLVSSAHTPVLRVIQGCGERVFAGRDTSTHVDTTFAAGTYQVIVDGATDTDVGSFVLNATILPM
jgi:hypothetical protein